MTHNADNLSNVNYLESVSKFWHARNYLREARRYARMGDIASANYWRSRGTECAEKGRILASRFRREAARG